MKPSREGPKTGPEARSTPAIPRRVFRYFERLRFSVKLYPPQNFRNPGAFDYTGYLAENGIAALGSSKAETVELLAEFTGNRAELWRPLLWPSQIERIHLPRTPDEAPQLSRNSPSKLWEWNELHV